MPLLSRFGDRLLREQPLARFTAARLGGPAEWLYVARESLDELADVVTSAWADGIPVRVLGGGANVLVSDTGVRGLVVINHVGEVAFTPHPPASSPTYRGVGSEEVRCVRAASGVSLTTLARKCAARGLSGFEWAVSVPGTIGGAVVNNAGAHGGDMAGCVREVEILDAEGGLQTLYPPDLAYDYRKSSLKERRDKRFLVLRATLGLTPDEPAAIEARMEGFIAHRKQTQPPGASLGSIFKNPPGDYAGRLIEAARLKGYTVGGAQVSPVHANFFINTGRATAADYYALIQCVERIIHEKFGIALEREVELVGYWV